MDFDTLRKLSLTDLEEPDDWQRSAFCYNLEEAGILAVDRGSLCVVLGSARAVDIKTS